jgi:hypothetical protein
MRLGCARDGGASNPRRTTVRRASNSKGRIEVSGRHLPTHQVSRRTPIDPSRFIPVVSSAARASDMLKVIHKADLFPKTVPAAAIAGFNNFGDLLVDIFGPTYGAHYPVGGRNAFIFSTAKVSFIRYDMWMMQIPYNRIDHQSLSFHIVQGAIGNYVKVALGMTQGAGSANGAIIGVKVDSNQFLLDLSHRSFQSFDLILSGASPHFFEFSLSSENNPRRDSIFEIQQVELYSTIRSFPSEGFES